MTRKQLGAAVAVVVGFLGVLALMKIGGVLPVKTTATPATTPVVKVSPTTAPTLVSATNTPVPPTETLAPAITETPGPTDTLGPTVTLVPSLTPSPATTQVAIAPYPSAPLCPDAGAGHDYSKFHTLWDSVRGCHYDHEHGQNPFTAEVAAAFPGLDLLSLNCYMQVGGCNPSSPIENLNKHGGMKWFVEPQTPDGCDNTSGGVGPFEGAQNGVDGLVAQYHNFGDYSIEVNGRIHSVVAMVRVCNKANPSVKGYMFVSQFVDYGERCIPYQGETAPYPDNPVPPYDCAFGPYLAINCIHCGNREDTREAILAVNGDNDSLWTSKATGPNAGTAYGSSLFKLLFRVRDIYQVFDRADFEYPFTFVWMCSGDGGLTFLQMPGCRYNNSTGTIHEVAGTIPATWDNLAGFDTAPAVGFITASGFVTHFGQLAPDCVAPGPDCFTIQMINMPVGTYGDKLTAGKISNTDPSNTPERDLYFCGQVQCAETSPGAQASGWLGPQN